MNQRPTVGRIVHWHSDKPNDPKGQPYPAIITHVWSDESVNLQIFGDVTFPLTRNAVPHNMPAQVQRGDGPGEWNWPPRDSA